MDERRIESVLRAGPPDEPRYVSVIATRLADRGVVEAGDDESASIDLVVLPSAPRRLWPAVAAFAAAAALLVTMIAVFRRPDAPVVTTPSSSTPTPTTTSPGPPPSGIAGLVDRWVGPPRKVGSLGSGTSAAFVVIDAQTLSYRTGIAETPTAWGSGMTTEGVDVIRLTLFGDEGGCAAGDMGRYRWTLSPGGTTLTLSALDDACSGRAAAISGSWTHTACPVLGGDCLGPVEAGEYASVDFDPFGSVTYGQVHYRLPAGWSVTADDRTRLVMQPTSAGGGTGIHLLADVGAGGCTAGSTPATSSSSEIVAWIRAQSDLEVASSTATIGGRRARVVDIRLGTDPAECTAEDGTSLAPVLAARPGAPTAWTWSLRAGQRMRLYLLDLDGGRVAAIAVIADETTLEDSLATASPIIASITFSSTP